MEDDWESEDLLEAIVFLRYEAGMLKWSEKTGKALASLYLVFLEVMSKSSKSLGNSELSCAVY